MLAYAANRTLPVDRRPHPNTMLLIIGAHVALVAVVMSAKMELPIRPPPVTTTVDFIPFPKDPPPTQQTKVPHPLPTTNPWTDHPRPQIPTQTNRPPTDLGASSDPGSIAGGGATTINEFPQRPIATVRSGPILLTPPSELKPPYPASKLLNEEEAVLKLKLTIDSTGRVIAVDPVGSADAAFLEAARRHLIARWRYKPANEDGQAIASTMVVTLHFELEG